MFVLVGTTVLAGALGWALGVRSHTTADELIAELRDERAPASDELSQEINRTLLELWRMEEAEYMRNRRAP